MCTCKEVTTAGLPLWRKFPRSKKFGPKIFQRKNFRETNENKEIRKYENTKNSYGSK